MNRGWNFVCLEGVYVISVKKIFRYKSRGCFGSFAVVFKKNP